MKCLNQCADMAEQNFTWPTSKGIMSANLCGVCASEWWNKFRNTPSGQTLTISPVKTNKELTELCAEY